MSSTSHQVLLLLLVTMCCLFNQSFATANDFIPSNYDYKTRPDTQGYPVNVSVQIQVLSLGPIAESTFTYKIDYYQRLWWRDYRLNFTNSTSPENGMIMLSSEPGETIWIPAIVVENSIKTEVDHYVRTIINSTGWVYVARRIKSTCTCKMDLKYYPMDKQSCAFKIEDFTYKSQEVTLKWHHKLPIIISSNEDLDIAGYSLLGTENKKNEVFYKVGGKLDAFDQLVMHINVIRTFNYYLYRVYIPSILLMVFNMASYWIPDTAVPARVGLIVTTFLTNTFILQSVTESTVQVPYTTALQIFLLGNVVLLVISIVEYLFVLYLKARKGKEAVKKDILQNGESNGAYEMSEVPQHALKPRNHPKKLNFFERSTTNMDSPNLDRVASFVVPLAYSIFVCAYFAYFLS